MTKDIKYNDWIDKSVLPIYGGIHGRIKWNDCYDVDVDFYYHGIQDTFKIIKPCNNGKMLIEYKKELYEISRDSLSACKLQYIVGARTHDFKYKVGEIIEFKKGRFLIKEQTYKSKKGKHNGKTKKYLNKANKIKCLDCGYEDTIMETNIAIMEHCPCCIHKKLLVGFNDMWTTNPEMAKMLKNPEDGYKHMKSSNKPKLEWVCPYCQSIINKTPNDVDNAGLCCPKCSDGISYPNKFMYSILTQINSKFETEKTFLWSNNKRYDFYLPEHKMIIEMHGIQHYKDLKIFSSNRAFEEEQKNDKYKKELALENGIVKYIEINCSEANFDYIKNSIEHSKLFKLLELHKIDWIKVAQDVDTPLIFKISELWNQGVHEASVLYEKLNISHNVGCKLLNRARNLGLCDYDSCITQAIGREKVAKIRYGYSKPLMCLDTNESFGNCSICINILNERDIKIVRRSLQQVLKENQSVICGFHFSYITQEEFNQRKDLYPDKTFGNKFNLDGQLEVSV